MWPFKHKYAVKEGRRYCPDCGNIINMANRAFSTNERVWCKTCNTFVWICAGWAKRELEGPMTDERLKLLETLIADEQRDRAIIHSLPKVVSISTHYCTFCGHPIDKTVERTSWPNFVVNDQFNLECPNCGDIRFYDVPELTEVLLKRFERLNNSTFPEGVV